MRITNSIIQSNATLALQQNLQQMVQAQAQVSSGNLYQSFADNPEAQSEVMQSSSSLRALDQYKKNVNDATARTDQEDTVLQQLTTTLQRAQEIATEQGTATASATSNAAAKAEVDDLISDVVGMGNTKYLNGYLFGGTGASTAPLSSTLPFYTGAAASSGEHTVEISDGQLFKSNHNAKEIFLNTNVMQSLTNLSTALGANNQAGISSALSSLQQSYSSVQSVVSDLGAREDQLQVTSSNIDALKTNLQTFKSSLSEADQAQVTTDLVTRQTAYQAAMLATSKVIGMTLTDYLQ